MIASSEREFSRWCRLDRESAGTSQYKAALCARALPMPWGRGPCVEGRWKSPPARGGTALSRMRELGTVWPIVTSEFGKVRERGKKEIQAEVDPPEIMRSLTAS